MIKKRTAAFFILLANIIILAHAVIPHHHLPHQAFLIISSLCNENKTGHHHPLAVHGHDHQHDNKNGNDHCPLKQIVGITTNALRQEYNSDLHANPHPDFGGFHAILADFQPDCFFPAIAVELCPPLLTSTYTCYVSGAPGLRAPPAI
jgi:hypothetical protein